jgi:hypothetical protein
MEVQTGGRLYTKVGAPHRDTPQPSWRFLAAIARLAMKNEVTP